MVDLDFKGSFQPSTADQASAKEDYLPGWVAATVEDVQKAISKDKPALPVSPNYCMFKFKFTPLQDITDPSSGVGRGLNTWQCLPMPLPHWDEAPEELSQKWYSNLKYFNRGCCDVLSALGVTPDVPRKVGDSLIFDGDAIDPSEYDTYKREAMKLAGELAVEMWNQDNVDSLVGKTCYIQIAYEPGQNRPSVKGFSLEAPVRGGRDLPINGLDGPVRGPIMLNDGEE